jgi:hypothetical protein
VKIRAARPLSCLCTALSFALLVAAPGCGDKPAEGGPGATSAEAAKPGQPGAAGKLGTDLKQAGKQAGAQAKEAAAKTGAAVTEAAQKTGEAVKEAGGAMKEQLAAASEKLAVLGKGAANGATLKGDALANILKAKLAEMDKILNQVKPLLESKGDSFKVLITNINGKHATLKTKLEELGKAGASATTEVKQGAVDAFTALATAFKAALDKLQV